MAVTSRLFASFVLCLLPILISCSAQSTEAVEYDYTILERRNHNPEIFTQGYIVEGNNFYESSGLYRRSFILRYSKSDDEGAEPAKRLDLPPNIFAEGLTLFNDRLYLLSWKEGQAWAFDKNSFEILDTYRYSGEGWGLTHDGELLIMSDGTATLRFYNEDFDLQGSQQVRFNGKALTQLNELEYHDGIVWANRWYDTRIFAINRHNGEVEAFVDLAALHREAAGASRESVVNGIAYDADADAFWVTGKYWRYQYLLRFTDKSP